MLTKAKFFYRRFLSQPFAARDPFLNREMCYYLRQGGYVFALFCLSVCLFGCLCVSKITQKVMDGSF